MKTISYFLIALLAMLSVACSDDNNKEVEEAKLPKYLYSTPKDGSVDVALQSEAAVVYNTPILLSENNGITVNNEKVNLSANGMKLTFDIALAKNTTYHIVIPEGAVLNTRGEKAAAISLKFSTVSDSKRYEAEDATLTGNASVESSLAGYSGTGYVNQKEGDIIFKTSVPESAKYKIQLRYWGNNGKKENDLYINGTKLSSISFDATDQWSTIEINNVNLKNGENTISIKKNWGWITLDYIEIVPAGGSMPFNIDNNLVTPSASKEAINLYTFLKENFGKKVISGAMANYSTGIEEAQWMYDKTGKWPALTGFDFINYTRDWSSINFGELVNNSEKWWNNNGLVTVMWHWRDPLRNTDGFYTKDTSFDITKVNDPNSAEYKAMIADIDIIAGYLKQLKDNNIPVIWRPLHEASGAWFWWGAKGAEPCKTLWRLMFDRLVNHHKLNNLIWVWTCDASSDALNWYPGNNYVDIIGMDIYAGENAHGSQSVLFDKIKELYQGKKLLALSECGSIPSVDAMFEHGDIWSWFMPWNGDYTHSDKYNGATYFKSLFNNDKVITRDKMPNLK